MRKFEYLRTCIVPQFSSVVDELDSLGLDGWEVINYVDADDGFIYVLFKREIDAK